MADQLFRDVKNAAALSADQASEVDVETVKAKFSKEDGTVDVDALLKAKAHADKHISKVEAEHAETKADRDRRLTYEDMLEKINSQRDTASKNLQPDGSERDDNPPQVIPEELISRKVDELLSKKQKEDRQVANVAYAAQELTKVWGEDFPATLVKRAKELDLSQDFLRDLARTNPQGFLNIVVPSTPRTVETSFTPPQSTTRTNGRVTSGEKNWAYYQNLKKTNREQYDSPLTAVEMDKQALKLGEDFYK